MLFFGINSVHHFPPLKPNRQQGKKHDNLNTYQIQNQTQLPNFNFKSRIQLVFIYSENKSSVSVFLLGYLFSETSFSTQDQNRA